MDIRLKRAYEPASPSDGYRVLIDRLWPRGLSKKRAKLDEWEKELPPSTELRTWFGHEPSRFPEFRRRYISELRRNRQRLTELRRRARRSVRSIRLLVRRGWHPRANSAHLGVTRGKSESNPIQPRRPRSEMPRRGGTPVAARRKSESHLGLCP